MTRGRDEPIATPRILMAASEGAPFAWTGGLGDVLDALPRALQELGAHVHVVLPAYASIPWDAVEVDHGTALDVWTPAGRRVVPVRTTRAHSPMVSFITADEYFGRAELYGGPHGDYPDNAARFAFFAHAVHALTTHLDPPPDIVHCHDWQTALVPVFMRTDERTARRTRPRTVLTIHNLAYQGIFGAEAWRALGLDPRYFTPQYLEFYGRVNFLKGGLVFADALTTVSPRYAAEILDPEHGYGLEGVLRERRDRLQGILNGADYTRWDPMHDPYLDVTYGPADLAGKARCKLALQRHVGLRPSPRTPLFAMVSRLVDQKGVELLLAALPELLQLDLQLVLLGRGDSNYEQMLETQHQRAPERFALRLGFDDALAHQIEAGADAFLMPSRYEPCGLSQMYSLRYGTVPVVRATGGLSDTVSDFDPSTGHGNGITFADYSPPALLGAVRRALDLYRHPDVWRRLMVAGMACDFSWQRSAQHYLALFQRVLASPR